MSNANDYCQTALYYILEESTSINTDITTMQLVKIEDINRRYGELKARLNKTETFIKYLKEEEVDEIEFYGMPNEKETYVDTIYDSFIKEKEVVLRSAEKYKRIY